MRVILNPISGKLQLVSSLASEVGAVGLTDANWIDLTDGGATTLHTHAGGGGDLLSANNLSDVSNVSTSRTNLGLVAGGAGDIWVEKAGDTMTGALAINGSGDANQLLVKAHSSQSNDVFLVQDNSGGTIMRVSGTPHKVGIRQYNDGTSTSLKLLASDLTIVPTAPLALVGAHAGIHATVSMASAYDTSGDIVGLSGYASLLGTANHTTAYGLNFIVTRSGTGTLTSAIGAYIAVWNNNASGGITNTTGVLITWGHSGGTWENMKGLQIEDVSYGTVSNYAIYTGRGQVWFGDKVQINNYIATNVALTVKAAGSQTGNLLEILNSSSSVFALQDSLGTMDIRRRTNSAGANTVLKLRGGGPGSGNGGRLELMTMYSDASYPTWNFASIDWLYNSADGGWAGNLIFNVNSGGGANNHTEVLRLRNSGLYIADGMDIDVGTTTGTRIGQSTSQKIGLWNTTPIVQPTTGIAESTFTENAGGVAVNDDSTFDGYTLGQVVKALRNLGVLA